MAIANCVYANNKVKGVFEFRRLLDLERRKGLRVMSRFSPRKTERGFAAAG